MNSIVNSTAMPVCATPKRVICDPVAPWAPERIRRNTLNDVFTINLSDDMEDASSEESEDDMVRRMDFLVFPTIDDVVSDDGGYQEHYTLPEDQLYLEDSGCNSYMEGVHELSNVTLFRGNRPVQSDDEVSELGIDEEPADYNDDVDTVVAILENVMDLEDDDLTIVTEVFYPSINVVPQEEEKRELQQTEFGPTFRFAEYNHHK